MSSGFEARYPGQCAACEERFEPGTEVAYVATGELVHVECPEVAEDAPAVVCPSCFLTVSVSGACSCD